MSLLGCLPILLLVLLILLLSMVGRGVQVALGIVLGVVRFLGDAVLWLWGSLGNLFLPLRRQRRVYNPFTGQWNMEAPILMTPEDAEGSQRDAKLYAADDGEYTDYEELPKP